MLKYREAWYKEEGARMLFFYFTSGVADVCNSKSFWQQFV